MLSWCREFSSASHTGVVHKSFTVSRLPCFYGRFDTCAVSDAVVCETVAGTPTGDPRNLTVEASDSAHSTETAPRLSPQQEDHMTRQVVTYD